MPRSPLDIDLACWVSDGINALILWRERGDVVPSSVVDDPTTLYLELPPRSTDAPGASSLSFAYAN